MLLLSHLVVAASEDAALVVVVMKLRAVYSFTASKPSIKLRGRNHRQRRRCEVYPQGHVFAGSESRPECSSGIHAHPGDRALERNEQRYERSGEERREPGQLATVRDEKDRREHDS